MGEFEYLAEGAFGSKNLATITNRSDTGAVAPIPQRPVWWGDGCRGSREKSWETLVDYFLIAEKMEKSSNESKHCDDR